MPTPATQPQNVPDAPTDNGPRRDDLSGDPTAARAQGGGARGSDAGLKNSDLHGFAPDSCPVALLIIDMINDMEFEGGEALYNETRPLAGRVAALREKCRAHGVPIVYVNDNFGRWQSDFQSVVDHVAHDTTEGRPMRGRELAQVLAPGEDDYFVLKPKHSGFYSTTLDLLLKYLGSRTLIMTGVAGDICVLFTANDAYMREFDLVVPRDGIASESAARNEHALEIMAQVLKAKTPTIEEIDLAALLHRDAAAN
jgi:nicotinamidase-related amidase